MFINNVTYLPGRTGLSDAKATSNSLGRVLFTERFAALVTSDMLVYGLNEYGESAVIPYGSLDTLAAGHAYIFATDIPDRVYDLELPAPEIDLSDIYNISIRQLLDMIPHTYAEHLFIIAYLKGLADKTIGISTFRDQMVLGHILQMSCRFAGGPILDVHDGQVVFDSEILPKLIKQAEAGLPTKSCKLLPAMPRLLYGIGMANALSSMMNSYSGTYFKDELEYIQDELLNNKPTSIDTSLAKQIYNICSNDSTGRDKEILGYLGLDLPLSMVRITSISTVEAYVPIIEYENTTDWTAGGLIYRVL